MNYIHKLQDTIESATLESAKIEESINDFLAYIHGKKFWADTSIQTSEVNKFLLQLRMDLPLKGKKIK